MSVLKENIRYHAILYLISPILGLIYGIRSKSLNYLRWSIFIFTVIYGSLFTIALFGGEIGVDSGADGARHLDHVYQHYQYLDFSVFWAELIDILSLTPRSSTQEDPFIHILSYIIGGVFNAPGLFFVGVAIVYGYFFSGAIVKIMSYINWNSNYNKFYFYFFLIILLMSKSPSDMQTVRTWTGMWVLIYAVLSYHETKKKKYLILAILPVTIHIGYTLLGLGVWLVLFTGFRNPKIYFIIFIFSVFFSNAVDQIGFKNIASQTQIGESKVNAYYMDDKKKDGKEKGLEQSNSNFYKKYEEYGIFPKVLSTMILFIYIFLSNMGFGKLENTLFSYGLATASFANFFTLLYAVHNRTWGISAIFILSLMVIFLSKQNFKKSRLSVLKIQIPLFLFFIALFPFFLLKLSQIINISSAFVLLTPFISWINPEVGISIKDLIVFFI